VRRAEAAPVAPATKLTGAVLLAEDGPDNQILVSTILRNLGLTVAVAGNGALASELALTAWQAGTPYDLVFMDMQMPVMDGYEATRRLRTAGYPGAIVALTAHAMQGELERCLGAGCNEYVRKPIERSHLLAVLQRYVTAGPEAPGAKAAETPPLVSVFADDPDMAAIVTRFVGGLPDRVAAMRAEATAGNHPALRRLAHQLKGAAGGYGFPAITAAAAALEAVSADGGDPALRERALAELAGLCGRARAVRT
jgi:CheY-like chemotaxis protein